MLAWNDPGAREIGAAASACLAAGGPLPDEQRRLLAAAVGRVRGRVDGGLYDEDASAYFRARDLLRVAAIVADASDPGVTGRR